MPFIQMLREARTQALAGAKEPWRLPLERVRGRIETDSIERISTQALFDLLEIPQRNRTAGACQRLAKIMRELGWKPIKARGLNQAGFRDQVRGYARDKRPSVL